MNHYIEDLLKRFPELVPCTPDIERAFSLMTECYRSGGKVLLCGNGGSAADAEHWAGELMKGFMQKRPLSSEMSKTLAPDLAEKLQGALPTIPLTGFLSLRSAFANDADPAYVFAQLVWGIGKDGDILVGISTSGNSVNIVHALETAASMEMKTIGLTGRDGGRIAGITDVCIRVPAEEVYRAQEYHLPVYHCLSLMLEKYFFPE